MSGHSVVETHGKESLFFFSKNGQNLVYSGQKNDGIKTYGGDRIHIFWGNFGPELLKLVTWDWVEYIDGLGPEKLIKFASYFVKNLS